MSIFKDRDFIYEAYNYRLAPCNGELTTQSEIGESIDNFLLTIRDNLTPATIVVDVDRRYLAPRALDPQDQEEDQLVHEGTFILETELTSETMFSPRK